MGRFSYVQILRPGVWRRIRSRLYLEGRHRLALLFDPCGIQGVRGGRNVGTPWENQDHDVWKSWCIPGVSLRFHMLRAIVARSFPAPGAPSRPGALCPEEVTT